MFIRSKKNRNGSVSIQLIDKSSGKYRVKETIGVALNAKKEQELYLPISAKKSIKLVKALYQIEFELPDSGEKIHLFNKLTPE